MNDENPDTKALVATLDAAREAYQDAKREVERLGDEAARKAKAEAEAPHKDRLQSLLVAQNNAARALRDHNDAQASHEWEGKRVVRNIKVKDGRFREREEAQFGVVEVRRSDTEFGANVASYRKPFVGQAFVRLEKKDGTLGLKIADLYRFDHRNHKWVVAWELAE